MGWVSCQEDSDERADDADLRLAMNAYYPSTRPAVSPMAGDVIQMPPVLSQTANQYMPKVNIVAQKAPKKRHKRQTKRDASSKKTSTKVATSSLRHSSNKGMDAYLNDHFNQCPALLFETQRILQQDNCEINLVEASYFLLRIYNKAPFLIYWTGQKSLARLNT